MAGDKKTILDIVKAVDKKEFFEDIASAKRSPYKMEPAVTIGVPEAEFRKKAKFKEFELRRLKKEAFAEEHPTAGGTYKGNVYYSNILPEGRDETPWSKRGSVLVKNAAQQNAKRSDIILLEDYFVDIGYMHPSEKDGRKGKQINAMIRRWNLNAGTSKEAMFDEMKNWKDNLFDGGAEEYEEDLREGGGDQGGY